MNKVLFYYYKKIYIIIVIIFIIIIIGQYIYHDPELKDKHTRC